LTINDGALGVADVLAGQILFRHESGKEVRTLTDNLNMRILDIINIMSDLLKS